MISSQLLKTAQTLDKSPGVYLFKDSRKKVIYVGKSISIRERVISHLRAKGTKSSEIANSASSISCIPVLSELEALLLEAELIKKHLPKYNATSRDDKHPLYIKVTTSEEFPKVMTSRREENNKSRYFGPFPASSTVKQVLRSLRRTFPYCSQKQISKRPCLYSHIGLCNPCPNYINPLLDSDLKLVLKSQYKSSIRKILLLLSGKTKRLEKSLLGDMKATSLREDFEKAGEIRDQLRRLSYITKPYEKVGAYLENPNLVADIRAEELKTLRDVLSSSLSHYPPPTNISRIECYDVAHTGGKATTCSMVTFIDGEPDKNFYRRFKIRRVKGVDDYASLKEALSRRLKHLEDWGRPDLIVIDGGKGQVSAALSVLHSRGANTNPPPRWNSYDTSGEIPVIGLTKRLEEIIIPLPKGGFKSVVLGKNNPAVKLLQRLRDEAHRFARSYHFKLRLKELLPSK
ncbi:MAG: GIY-YIG nuclease family protein [Patescibacteria group bacterium]